jgi:TatD DNase family protein
VRLFDSHAHLTDESLTAEFDAVMARAAIDGVESVVSIASDLDDAGAAIELARAATRPRLRATAGIHPHVADVCTVAALTRLEGLASSEEVVAIGETGLDFHYDNAPREVQLEAFRSQIELAERLGLPVVVHSREADAETAATVREYAGRVEGVLHCFSGGRQLLDAGLASDWYVSFSGIVTFKKFADIELVRAVPADRLLVETDSPYLAPVPKRGRRNEPAFVRYVIERVAEMRDESLDGVAEATYLNACRFYGLDP